MEFQEKFEVAVAALINCLTIIKNNHLINQSSYLII